MKVDIEAIKQFANKKNLETYANCNYTFFLIYKRVQYSFEDWGGNDWRTGGIFYPISGRLEYDWRKVDTMFLKLLTRCE